MHPLSGRIVQISKTPAPKIGQFARRSCSSFAGNRSGIFARQTEGQEVKPRGLGEGMQLMISLVSPNYNFRDFCQCLVGKDPLQVIDAASAEITYARLIHQEKRKNRDFRRGSRGRAYCDDLQQLISLFMGSTTDKVSQEFLDAVDPLARHLLQRWRFLDFANFLPHTREAKPGERTEEDDQLADRNANPGGKYQKLILWGRMPNRCRRPISRMRLLSCILSRVVMKWRNAQGAYP